MSAQPKKKSKKKEDYKKIILQVFRSHYSTAVNRFTFTRPELVQAAANIGVKLSEDDEEESTTKNIGDVVYTYRFRREFPEEILHTAPQGKMWIITGKGDGLYEFRLITTPVLNADPGLYETKVHDATPEIVRRFALNDEQAVLARIRCNRLIDLFCKCVAFSLQNHLRTKITGIGQIEIDELYVGSNRQGEHFIIPVQVKRPKDKLGVSQLLQDLEYCRINHSTFTARAIGAQQFDTRNPDLLALFEFECQDVGDDVIIRKRAERHFLLRPFDKITDADFEVAKGRKDTD